MFSKSVYVGRAADGFVKSVRGLSTSSNLANSYYSSALPERFYNEEQLQMQQSLKKVNIYFHIGSMYGRLDKILWTNIQ